VWNVEKQEAVYTVAGPNDPYYSLDWSLDGALLVTANKDKTLRIVDPRSNKFASEFKGHEGPKGQKAIWLGNSGLIYSVGFNKNFQREYCLWDSKNLEKPAVSASIDQQASVLYPFFDSDTNMLYLSGRGDTNIRLFELMDGKLHSGINYTSDVSQKGMGFLPKRYVDVGRNELVRAIKLTENYIETISFIQPRKGGDFQEDLFPDCIAETPAVSGDEWFSEKPPCPREKH